MNADKTQDQLAKSIRVINIPASFDKNIIINYLKSAGELVEVVPSDDQLAVTYETISQRNTSLNLIGHSFEEGDYTLQIEQLQGLNISKESEFDEPEIIKDDFEVVHGSPGSESPIPSVQQIVDENTVNQNADEGFEKIGLEEAEKYSDISVEEVIASEPKKLLETSKQDEEIEAINAEVVNEFDEIKMKFDPISTGNKTKLRDDDPFQEVIKKNYLITFTVGWAVLLFIRSVT